MDESLLVSWSHAWLRLIKLKMTEADCVSVVYVCLSTGQMTAVMWFHREIKSMCVWGRFIKWALTSIQLRAQCFMYLGRFNKLGADPFNTPRKRKQEWLAIKFELVKNRVNANSVSEGLLFPTALRNKSLYLLSTCKCACSTHEHWDTWSCYYLSICALQHVWSLKLSVNSWTDVQPHVTGQLVLTSSCYNRLQFSD